MLHNNDFYGEFFDDNIRTYLRIHVKCVMFFFLSDLNQILISSTDRYKSAPPPVTDFYGNPSNGSNSNTRRQTERLRRHGEAIWRFSRLMRTRLKKNTHTHTEPQSGGLSIFRDSNSEPPNTK